jgi:hypothetical protein
MLYGFIGLWLSFLHGFIPVTLKLDEQIIIFVAIGGWMSTYFVEE